MATKIATKIMLLFFLKIIFIYVVCVLCIVVFIVDLLEDMTLFELLMRLTSLRFFRNLK